MKIIEPQDISQLLNDLSGKPAQVKVASETPLQGSGGTPIFAGIYVADGDDKPTAAVVVDFPLALAAAGTLAGIPPGVILDDLKEKYVDDSARENLYEVLNIAASLFNETGGKHLRLAGTAETLAEPEGDLKTVIDSTSSRLDLEVTLAPCPTGRLTVLQAA